VVNYPRNHAACVPGLLVRPPPQVLVRKCLRKAAFLVRKRPLRLGPAKGKPVPCTGRGPVDNQGKAQRPSRRHLLLAILAWEGVPGPYSPRFCACECTIIMACLSVWLWLGRGSRWRAKASASAKASIQPVAPRLVSFHP